MCSTKKKTTEQFIQDAINIHGDKYDYSKVEYINNITKVCIICPEHGEFWQTPKSHLNKHGCRLCGDNKSKEVNIGKSHKNYAPKEMLNTETFIEKSKEIHGDKYDYSKVKYKSLTKPVIIICLKHGEFLQRPLEHIKQKSGCPLCANESRYNKFVMTQDNFINRSKQIFNGVYKYDNVKYVNNSTKVIITCVKHGDFLCTPQNHLKGRGCPICKSETYVYENRLYNFLLTLFEKDEIIRQYKALWLSNNKTIDFYIPKYRIAIEHQGSQHFKPINYLGGIDKFNRTKILDLEKYQECIDNNVKILYFMYEKYINTENFFTIVYKDEISLKNKIEELIK